MKNIPNIQLNNGVEIPQIGLGSYKVSADVVYENVKTALEVGYRHIDTASFYENEEGVGQAIQDSSIPRKDIFVTTKVWNDQQGFTKTKNAFAESMEKLGIDYIDLYLIHWPIQGTYLETWQALEELYEEGKVRAIGVSNFLPHHLNKLLEIARIKPVINQIELHPKLYQKKAVDYCQKENIAIEAWAPIGKATYLDHPVLQTIAKDHQKSPAQIILKWHLQQNFIIIPKSLHRHRQKENIDLFDFELTAEEMEQISNLDEGYRLGSHPDEIGK